MATRLTCNWKCLSIALVSALAVLTVGVPMSSAEVTFKGRTITVLVGSTAGGSTDASARLLARFMGASLPGVPEMVVVNRPGAKGLNAQNFFASQVAADGLTLLVASGSQIDPTNYRVPQSRYDPTTYVMVGGLDVGGAFLILRREYLSALMDRSQSSVAMGSVPGVPRSGMNMVAWGNKYLGWNARWITGYTGTPELMLALERGEIGMTSFANQEMRSEFLDQDRYVIIYQSGIDSGTRPADHQGLQGVPLFAQAMDGRFKTEIEEQAFGYWRAISSIIKWMALPPNTPADIARVHQEAFNKTVESESFKDHSRQMNEEANVILAENLTRQVQALADLPESALNYMLEMLQEQGVTISR